MYGLGFWQMLVILFIFLVMFGPKRLPDLGDSLGKAIRNFRTSLRGDEIDSAGQAESIDDKNTTDKDPS